MATSEKIQLKGASQYKKDLQQIAAESKALSSEMKAVKSSFDKSTTAQQKNEAIGKQLSKQIENQQKMVDKLRQAYEAEVAVSGEQSVAAQKAKNALNKGQIVLNNLQAENRALAESEKEETKVSQAQAKAKQAFNAIAKASAAAVAAVASAAAAAAKAIWDATNASGEWADNLLTLSAQTNVSTDTLQKWDYAARFIDVDTQTMTTALSKVVKQQGAAIKSGQDYVTTLDGQVISLRDSNGELKSSETVFYEMIDALGQIGDATMQEAAAQDLFGKSFQDIMPLVKAGSEGLKAYGDEAEELGLVLSGESVGALGAFDDQMQRLKATMETAGRELAVSFLPATQEVARSLTELASTVTTALSDGFQDEDVDTILGGLFDNLSRGLENVNAIMPAVTKFVTGLINKILEFVITNLPMLVQTALQIITGLANGLIENLPVLIPAIVECVLTIVQTLMAPENIGMLVEAAIALITGLGQGLINAIPVLVRMLPQIVTNMVQSLILQGQKMMGAGNALINNLSTGISTAMSGLMTKVRTWVQEKIVQPMKDKVTAFASVGRNMVEGLWKGISDKLSWIKSQISRWVGNVVDFFKSKLGIHSPSTVFAGIGENMALGLANGWTDGLSSVRNAMSAVPGINGSYSLDASPAGMGGINVYIDGIKYNSDEYVDSSITNFVESMVRRSQMYGRA